VTLDGRGPLVVPFRESPRPLRRAGIVCARQAIGCASCVAAT